MFYSSVLMDSSTTGAASATSVSVDDIPSVLFDGQIKVKIVKAKRTSRSKAPVIKACQVVVEAKLPVQAGDDSPETTAEVSLPTPETADGGADVPKSSDDDGEFVIGKDGYRYKRFSEPGVLVVTPEWWDFVIAPFGVIGGPIVEPTAGVFMLGMEAKEKWEIVAQANAAHPPWPDRSPEPYRPWMGNWDRFHSRVLEGTAF